MEEIGVMRGKKTKKKPQKTSAQILFPCDLLAELHFFTPGFQEVMETEGKTLTVLGHVHLLMSLM